MNISELYNNYFDMSCMLKPYTSSDEHLKELFAFLDLCFAAVSGARGLTAEGLPREEEAGRLNGLTVASKDLAGVLVSGQRGGLSDTLSDDAVEQIENAYFHIQCRLRKSALKEMIPRFEVVRIKFGLSEFEAFAMLLSLAPEYDRKYESAFVYLHNNSSDIYATVWLAQKLYELFFDNAAADAAKLISGESPLMRYLCTRDLKPRERSSSSQWLLLSKRVSSYIMGINRIDPTLSGFCTLLDSSLTEGHIPVREEQFDKATGLFAANAFSGNGCFVLDIYGPKGIGRCYMAAKTAAAFGLDVLRIDLCRLTETAGQSLEKYLDMIYTETVLLGAMPCFVSDAPAYYTDSEGTKVMNSKADKLSAAASYIARMYSFVFWVTQEKTDSFVSSDAVCVGIELPMLTANERKAFWEHELEGTGVDAVSLANRYILAPLDIKRACKTAFELAKAEDSELTEEFITQGIKQHSVNPLGNYAARINAVFTWDDLVVSDEQKTKMKMICDQVRYRSIVNEDWGFRKKTPYGRGLCALFYGSPGTGKTMAVQVMANDLGLDLYRIDLSQLSSKYIGETQKNISALFERAKNINAMLFFDEADSMFAKRSEVKDANDRYANADTAFLLQKLEEHEGITILATNYVNNIDDAFKRRIRFMINFVFPAPDVRLRLWRTILPSSAKVDEALDFEFFAERFELSGSNIKEILTNAAFLAASEGTGIRNSHIIEAVKLNYSKYGKILTNADFDYLG